MAVTQASPAVGFDTRLLLIGGQWRPGDSGRLLPLHNPSDGQLLAQIAHGNAADADAEVAAAQAALAPGVHQQLRRRRGHRAAVWQHQAFGPRP